MYPAFKVFWHTWSYDIPDIEHGYFQMYMKTETADITAVIFDERVSPVGNHFYYTMPISIMTGDSTPHFLIRYYKNGDSNSPDIDITSLLYEMDSTGTSQVSLAHSASIVLTDVTMPTGHSIFLDRTEYYGTPSKGGPAACRIFWETHNISAAYDTSNEAYAYNKEPALQYATFPDQSTASNRFKIVRSTPALYKGINVFVHFDATVLSGSYNDCTLYIDKTTGTDGTFLGVAHTTKASYGTVYRSDFTVPPEIVLGMQDASFAGATLYLQNGPLPDTTWGVYDTYLSFDRAMDSTMTTGHDVTINDNTTPTITKHIQTTHKARVKRGNIYVIDYYTPTEWYNFSRFLDRYSYEYWNYVEEIIHNFGRFYQSPQYYSSQLPDFGTVSFIAKATNTFTILEDYPGAQRSTGIYRRDGTSLVGWSFTPYIGTLLALYSPTIEPEMVEDDGTFYRLSPFVKDNTIGVHVLYNTGGSYEAWDSTRTVPFVADHTFYLSFYGKKG